MDLSKFLKKYYFNNFSIVFFTETTVIVVIILLTCLTILITFQKSPILWITIFSAVYIKFSDHFNKMTIGSIAVFIFVSSFVSEHLACLSDLEAEQKVLMSNKRSCEQYDNEYRITKWLFGSNKEDCHEVFQKTESSYVEFCSSTTVVARMFAKFGITFIHETLKGITKILIGENFIIRAVFWILIPIGIFLWIKPKMQCLLKILPSRRNESIESLSRTRREIIERRQKFLNSQQPNQKQSSRPNKIRTIFSK